MNMKLDEMSVGDLYDAGSEAMSKKQYDDAVRYFEVLIEKAPTHLKGRERLALSQAVVGKLEESLANFEFLLKDDPENADYIRGKGSALFKTPGKEKEGFRLLNESLKMKNDMGVRGQLIKMRFETINLMDIKGIGDKFTQRHGNFVVIDATKLLTEVGQKCIENNAMVKVEDVARESQTSELQTIEKYLETVNSNGVVKGHIALVDDVLLIEFIKPEKQT